MGRKVYKGFWLSLGTAVTIIVLFSCNIDRIIMIMTGAESNERISEEFSKSNLEFTLDMYSQLLNENVKKNVFFSPFSISVAMAMTHLGARGETKTELEKTLKFDRWEEDIHTAFELYLPSMISEDTNCTLKIANKIYPHIKAKIPQEFLDLCKKYYNTDIKCLNFAESKKSREEINRWVSEQTKEKIKEVIPPGVLNDLTVMVLVNAIYLKGNWKKMFEKERTKPGNFYNLLGKKKSVDMMTQTRYFPLKHSTELLCSMIELPYVGDSMSMIIVLPVKPDGLTQLEQNLTPGFFSNLSKGFYENKVVVTIPKFKLDSCFELSKMFKTLGMKQIFDADDADLSGIDPDKQTYVSHIFHKAFVDVNEEGTEAATVSCSGWRGSSLGLWEPEEFRADHPFIFFIRDKKTGVILFMGRFVDVP